MVIKNFFVILDDNIFVNILTNIDTCRYWHLSFFRPQFLTKNAKLSNLDEILYFTQTEGGELNGGNSFFVVFDTCQNWQLSIWVPVYF